MTTLSNSMDSKLIHEVTPAMAPSLTILERKGLGHPDTLADHLAERISAAYSRWTRDNFGAVLHHNFDKLTMHGGSVVVRYGGGEVTGPIKIMVNGRATRRCAGKEIPVESIANSEIRQFFEERLPDFTEHLDVQFNITSNSSPGAVHVSHSPSQREAWFDVQDIDQLRERKHLIANDTSMGTGFAPLTSLEGFARDLVNQLSGTSSFTAENPWCGSDVKMMLMGNEERFDAVLCVPQISRHVKSRNHYIANRDLVKKFCISEAIRQLGAAVAESSSFTINARDIDQEDELYLTLSGSSLESGDEGVVGRGNRANGLITPLRPMNLEGVNGKNPVYHVGKLYNVAAELIAANLAATYGCEAHVTLISATGQSLADPWRVLVRTSSSIPTHEVIGAVKAVTESFPDLTERILAGKIVMA